MSKKPKRKVKLPTDRNGTPINVDDVVGWDDGTICRVETLTYLGEEFEDAIGSWVINIETDCYDNLRGCEVIRKAVKR